MTRKSAIIRVLVVFSVVILAVQMTHLDDESEIGRQSKVQKDGLEYSIKALTWKDGLLEIDYSIVCLDRDKVGYICSLNQWVKGTAFFWTRTGERMNCQSWDYFGFDPEFQCGSKYYLFNLCRVPCSSQKIKLNVEVPEKAEYVAVKINAGGPETKSIRIPSRQGQNPSGDRNSYATFNGERMSMRKKNW